MQNFRTSARHLITQGILLASLMVFTMLSENFNSITKVPVLLIVDFIVFGFFLASIVRRVTIEGDKLESKTLFRKSSVQISQIEYTQALSAFGRWVLIINDGNRTVVLTSLIDGLEKILEIIRPTLKEEDFKRIELITAAKIKSKKLVYDSVMIFLSAIVWYGIIRISGTI